MGKKNGHRKESERVEEGKMKEGRDGKRDHKEGKKEQKKGGKGKGKNGSN